MSTNKKFMTFSIAGIAVLTSIIAVGSQVQAEQSFVTVRPNTEYTVAQVYQDGNRDGNRWYDDRDGIRRHNNRNNRRAWALWERGRWVRYNRCVRHSHYPSQCRRLLREPNHYERHDYY